MPPSKADYVRQEAAKGHDGTHGCHAEGCRARCAPAYFSCPKHWRMVPRPLQMRIWSLFRPGQERDKVATREYLAVAREAIEAIATAEGRRTPQLNLGLK